MKKYLMAGLLGLALAGPASATLQLSALINGILFNCQDQAACDTNLLVGQMSLANVTLGGVDIFGSSQVQTIGSTNFLNTSSFQIVNHNLFAVQIELAISGTGFLGPVTQYAASGSGTWQNANGSNLTISYYGDPANGQGADTPNDLPGLLLASFADAAVGPADSFAFNNSGVFGGPNPFSMSLGSSGTLAAWNGQAGTEPTLVGRNQTIITTQVPEPGTLALMGLALLAFGVIRKVKH